MVKLSRVPGHIQAILDREGVDSADIRGVYLRNEGNYVVLTKQEMYDIDTVSSFDACYTFVKRPVDMAIVSL